MNWFASIADEKIREAIRKGEFDNLPGAGKPLPPEDDAMVPDELRMAYKVLKNAGALPEEMQLRKDMVTLSDLIAACRDETERTMLRKELSMKKVRYQTLMSDRGWHSSGAFLDYEQQILKKMTDE
ncbi:DUF1992 domain-containing protein [Cohnella pontilimi]|uniref:DUF1992 domain-containing protein n=1 Tax=Cohnella pontilimi TaxID=2564100 RepID=A0A4U0FAR1_9BACL|nr:DUF1992 domain-containing protein [Cohnella pontilimi]TJY41741.1 DUF1992 domain-containing protein [Cohnella pontilimi]